MDAIDRLIAVYRSTSVIDSHDNVLVRQWAANAAESYTDVPEVLTTVTKRLADKEEDLDVRFNCLAAIKRMADLSSVAHVLSAVD